MDINIIKESIEILEEFDPKAEHSENEIKLFKQAVSNATTSMNYILVAYHLTNEMIDKTKEVKNDIKSDPDMNKVKLLLTTLLPYDWEYKVLFPGITYYEEIDKSGIWYEIDKNVTGKAYALFKHVGKDHFNFETLCISDSLEEVFNKLKDDINSLY